MFYVVFFLIYPLNYNGTLLHALWSNCFIPLGMSDVIEREIEFEVVEKPGRNECEGADKAVAGLAVIRALYSGTGLWKVAFLCDSRKYEHNESFLDK